jgi:hypothetical protein
MKVERTENHKLPLNYQEQKCVVKSGGQHNHQECSLQIEVRIDNRQGSQFNKFQGEIIDRIQKSKIESLTDSQFNESQGKIIDRIQKSKIESLTGSQFNKCLSKRINRV